MLQLRLDAEPAARCHDLETCCWVDYIVAKYYLVTFVPYRPIIMQRADNQGGTGMPVIKYLPVVEDKGGAERGRRRSRPQQHRVRGSESKSISGPSHQLIPKAAFAAASVSGATWMPGQNTSTASPSGRPESKPTEDTTVASPAWRVEAATDSGFTEQYGCYKESQNLFCV